MKKKKRTNLSKNPTRTLSKRHAQSKEELLGIKKKKKRKKARKKKHKQKKQQLKSLILELLLAGLSGLIVPIIILFMFFTLEEVSGFGMVPTMRAGEITLVKKTKDFKRFDVIVFSSAGKKSQVRRVIGLPGDKIRYEKDTLFVNDEPITEKFIVDEINDSQKNGKDFTENFSSGSEVIPKNSYLVLGDNRPYATDSRHYGLIHEKDVIGKARMKLINFEKI